VSNFGDFDPADAFDTEPADPEQVAIKLQKLRVQLDSNHPRWRRPKPWDELDEDERAIAIGIVVELITWMRRQGSMR
jgi:hypothetical protein